jgi:hypothetical protein
MERRGPNRGVVIPGRHPPKTSMNLLFVTRSQSLKDNGGKDALFVRLILYPFTSNFLMRGWR